MDKIKTAFCVSLIFAYAAIVYNSMGLPGVILLVSTMVALVTLISCFKVEHTHSVTLDKQVAKAIALWYFNQSKEAKKVQKEGQK